MDTSDIESAILHLASRMHDEGVDRDGVFLVDPALLFARLRRERPDVISALKRRFPALVPERDLRDLVPSGHPQDTTRLNTRVVRRRPRLSEQVLSLAAPLGNLYGHAVSVSWRRGTGPGGVRRRRGDLPVATPQASPRWPLALTEAVDLGTGPIDSPVWDTVERLQTSRPELAARLALLALRSVHLVGWDTLVRLATGPHRGIERIWPLELAGDDAVAGVVPPGAVALSAVTHFALCGTTRDPWAVGRSVLDLEMPLEVLRLETHRPPSDVDRSAWSAHRTLQRVEWRGGHWDRGKERWTATLPAIGTSPARSVQTAAHGAMTRLDAGVLHPTLWRGRTEDGDDLLVGIDPRLHTVDAVPTLPGVHLGHPLQVNGLSVRLFPRGTSLGPAPWEPALVDAARTLLEQVGAAVAPRELDLEVFEQLVRGANGALVLLGPRTGSSGGMTRVRERLASHVPGSLPWAAATTTGPTRMENEDTFAVDPSGVWVVVDGIGGHVSGVQAASLIAAALRLPGGARERFRDAIASLHPDLLTYGGTGGTAVRLAITGTTAEVSWMGDCRAYLLRAGRITGLTEDHSLVRQRVLRGEIEDWETPTHPLQNVVLRGVFHQGGEPDCITLDLVAGDRILLVSDGVWRALDDETTNALVAAPPDLAEAVTAVLAEANRVCGIDNATALLVAFDGPRR